MVLHFNFDDESEQRSTARLVWEPPATHAHLVRVSHTQPGSPHLGIAILQTDRSLRLDAGDLNPFGITVIAAWPAISAVAHMPPEPWRLIFDNNPPQKKQHQGRRYQVQGEPAPSSP